MVPEPPHYLGNIAKEEWRRLAKDVFKDDDRRHLQVFALYCEAYELWRRALERLHAEEITQITPNGHEQPHSCISTHNQCLVNMQRLANNLGFTPEARMKIETSHKKKEEVTDPWEQMKRARAKAGKRLDA